jgi:hypothetical protein
MMRARGLKKNPTKTLNNLEAIRDTAPPQIPNSPDERQLKRATT